MTVAKLDSPLTLPWGLLRGIPAAERLEMTTPSSQIIAQFACASSARIWSITAL